MIFLILQKFKIQLNLFLLAGILASFHFLRLFILSLFLRLIIFTYINFLDFRILNWLVKCLCYPDESYLSCILKGTRNLDQMPSTQGYRRNWSIKLLAVSANVCLIIANKCSAKGTVYCHCDPQVLEEFQKWHNALCINIEQVAGRHPK